MVKNIWTKVSFKERILEENFIATKVPNASNEYEHFHVQGVKKI